MVAYAGFFADAQKARNVLQALKDRNYKEEEVLMIEPATGDDLSKALSYAKSRDYITQGVAGKAAAGLEKGKTFLVTKARLGSGLMVEKLYADNGAEMVSTWTDTARHVFFSDIVGLPLLASVPGGRQGPPEARRPLSEMLNLPCLIKREGERHTSLGMPLLAKPLMTGSMIPLLAKQKTGN